MVQWILDLASRYGYAIVFAGVVVETFGMPFPGETAILVGSVLAAQHRLNIVAVGLVAWSAAVIGPSISYGIFRRWGGAVMRLPGFRRIYTPERVAIAERFFGRHGRWAVFGTRFVVFLRIFTGPLAGLHRMPFGHFEAANAAGAAVWVTAVCVVGELVGSNLDRAERLISTAGDAGLAIVVVLVVAYVAWHWRHRHRAG